MKKFVAYLEGFLPYFIVVAGVLGLTSISAFIGVIVSENVACFVGELLGTGIKDGKKETLQFLGWIISGVIAFFGLLAINRRAAAQDDANRLIEKGHDQDRSKADAEQSAKERSHVQDRFRTAVEHLSNERTSARVASFYEFFYLARDVPDYAENILGILCAHLRYTRDTEDPEQKLTEPQILIDILFSSKAKKIFGKLDYDLRRAILRGVDFQKMHKPKGDVDFSYANLSDACFDETDLRYFNFREANLHNASFTEADLQNADLYAADLSNTQLSNANLSDAMLILANMPGAMLLSTNFSGADLMGANMSGTRLIKTNFSGADLSDVELSGVEFSYIGVIETNFSGAKLSGANFSTLDLSDVDLSGVDLHGANLSRVKNLQAAKLSKAKYGKDITGKDTKFPKGFKPEDHGMIYCPPDDKK